MEELTLEQEAYLVALKARAETMSHQQLVRALVESEEQRLVQLAVMRQAMYQMGGVVQAVASEPPCAPDLEELTALFGYEPTEDEAWDYWRTLNELSTMDVDLEAVVIDAADEDDNEREELSRWRN